LSVKIEERLRAASPRSAEGAAMSTLNFKDVNTHKLEEVRRKRARRPVEALRAAAGGRRPCLSLSAALSTPGVALIAEVKRQALSGRQYRAQSDFHPAQLARTYVDNGAAAVSVLVDELFFGGASRLLEEVNASIGGKVPILYKEFVVDPYQVSEAWSLGADAVLIIARPPVDAVALRESIHQARELGMESMVEIFTVEGAAEALEAGARIIGINNRDYPTNTVDVERYSSIRSTLPAGVLSVSETGLKSAEDVRRARQIGFDGVLIGEAILIAADVAGKVRELSRAGRAD
jgi:indole-3-glycerol phosphate synthase